MRPPVPRRGPNSQGPPNFHVSPCGQVRPFAAGNPIVRFAGVTRAYGSRVALDDVHLELQPGELAFLVGPSGPGKTTILKLINRELRPTHGQVLVAGSASPLPARLSPSLCC